VATAPSIRVVKDFTYRGVVRQFSNRYHFHGGTPADGAHWTTLSDAIVTAEKAVYQAIASGGAKITATVGYAGGSEIPVFNKTYTTDGTASFAGPIANTPGDCAIVVRYSTSDRSSKNHPIYCFNYYHAAYIVGGASGSDTVNAAQRSAFQTYAANWVTGFSDGTNTYIRSRPNGNSVTGSLVELLISHRDLPR
jgi:hypothetical protein